MVGLNFMVIGAGLIVLGAKQVHKSWLAQAIKHNVVRPQEMYLFTISAGLDIDEPGTQNLKSELYK